MNNVKIDRTGWGNGPWDDEPDRIEWRTEAGLPALLVRSDLGSWCGYVAVGTDHPYYNKDYDSVDCDVHGGLTYADKCSKRVCHSPAAGESKDVWWLGFDAAHYDDYTPAHKHFWSMLNRELGYNVNIYRDVAYMKAQCESLANQLQEVKNR